MDKTPLQREIRLREALRSALVSWGLNRDISDCADVTGEAEAAIAESEAATAPQPLEITQVILQKIMPHLPAIKRADYLPYLNAAMQTFKINTPLRAAAFLAQIAHESGELKYMEEIWGNTKAQKGYEGRADLGNTELGDGYKYRGRGPIQLTGRANYKKASDFFGVDFVNNPDLAADPQYAFQTAALYWNTRGLNVWADQQNFIAITRAINGGTNGLAEREKYYETAKKALGI